MPRVRIQPSGIELDVQAGESVAEAAWRQDYVWPTRCWGQADCMSCFARIVDGELAARPAGPEELDAVRFKMAERLRSDPLVRLACRLEVVGNGLVLHKAGVRPAQAEDNNMTQAQDNTMTRGQDNSMTRAEDNSMTPVSTEPTAGRIGKTTR